MPIYEYECQKCNSVTEQLQRFSDPDLKKCPDCGGKTKKLMSLNSFQLKGSGWYVTDYAGKNSSTQKGETPDKPKAEESSKSDTSKKAKTSDD